MKKFLVGVAVILAIFWVINAPDKAAKLIDKVGNAITTISSSFG